MKRVLTVAGSDSGGGAGVQADIKTITSLGAYATSAVTALTAQNTLGVQSVHEVPADFVAAQIRAVLSDIGVDAVKVGMLASIATIEAVAAELRSLPSGTPIVLDPVMVAKDGTRLLNTDANNALKRDMALIATLVTPNIPEAEELVGFEIQTLDEMNRAAEMMLTLGSNAVLIKGGHLPDGGEILNVLMTQSGHEVFVAQRLPGNHTHGTGCTLSSAIATFLAQELPVESAVRQGIEYVSCAVAEAPGIGAGHGPLMHMNAVARRALTA